jgi:cell division protein FtsI (penicillin-binding protein 3)
MIELIQKYWRFYCVVFFLTLMLLALLLKMFIIQAVDLEYGAAFLKQQGDRRTIREEVVMANRGQIVDRRGAPLAISTPV